MVHGQELGHTSLAAALELKQNCNFADPQGFPVQVVAKTTSLVPRLVDAAQKPKNRTEDPGRQAQATLEDGLAKVRALTQLQIIPQRLRKNAYGLIADQQDKDKANRAIVFAVQCRSILCSLHGEGDKYPHAHEAPQLILFVHIFRSRSNNCSSVQFSQHAYVLSSSA